MATLTNESAVLSFLLFMELCLQACESSNTITTNQPLKDGETLLSPGKIMVLGFFSPGSSQDRYLGIWYKMDPAITIVWVANRENPIRDPSGIFTIGADGNLEILNRTGNTFWSSNASIIPKKPRSAQLLDSGNLILIEDNDDKIIWQSFDYPADTLLTGMKLGIDRKTGLTRVLTSWRSLDDPFPGNFSSGIDPSGSPQLMTWDKSVRFFRGGPWNGQRYTGFPEMKQRYIFNFSFVNNQDEISYTADLLNTSMFSRLVLTPTGVLQRFLWSERSLSWIFIWSHPKDQCDYYAECGSFGDCNSDNWPICTCLKGFEPKSPADWYLKDFRQGCVRRTGLKCGEGDGFMVLRGMKMPDTSFALVYESLSLMDCEAKCLENCSCTAYGNSDILDGGSGCVIWTGDLIDLREFPNNGEDLYIRMAGSELDIRGKKQSNDSIRGKRVIAIVTTTCVLVVILICFSGFCLRRKKLKRKEKEKQSDETSLFELGANASSHHNLFLSSEGSQGRNNDRELPLLEMRVVAAATNDFSDENKLGEGGFGPVYKGLLPGGEIVAVKRLSMGSQQGRHEFKNEVILISKLQHRNLVRLLGCCIQGEENILIYEYMPNKSLDFFLFDETKNTLLDWKKRYNIIIGIARGLLYLHQDSRLRIIHRDLKASNILLDDQMNPKISDFGMARIFGESQIQANTRTVVGTYSYMAPEYIMDGLFSAKSDVFSFGVLLLEIISGRSNRGFFHCEHSLNLLGHAWTLWKECRALELLDPCIRDSYATSKVLRSIQVGLLCVQQYATDRPDMASVVSMLSSSETSTLPLPNQPAFASGRTLVEKDSSSNVPRVCSFNDLTTSVVEPR